MANLFECKAGGGISNIVFSNDGLTFKNKALAKGEVPSFSFTNLTIGNKYRVCLICEGVFSSLTGCNIKKTIIDTMSNFSHGVRIDYGAEGRTFSPKFYMYDVIATETTITIAGTSIYNWKSAMAYLWAL